MLHFYPSLSDSSYIKIDDPKDSVEALHKDFPDMDSKNILKSNKSC